MGGSYNARFELNHSAKTIREIWRPPLNVGLMDLVLGFPFSPSDMEVRREWAFQVGLFELFLPLGPGVVSVSLDPLQLYGVHIMLSLG